ncbi:MAG: hypothetical protein Kow0059_18320 [Candidatus Sumerlaeia bacterium]
MLNKTTGKPFTSLSTAFTLIELLIVVAIIAILAAIAVPNFLEAQVRAKVARCQADMRSLATAVEAYAADWNRYPPYGRVDPTGSTIQLPATVNNMYDLMSFISPVISTPVAYITSVPLDVFFATAQGPGVIHQIEYINLVQHIGNFGGGGPSWAAQIIPAWGQWRMSAAGPDRDRGVDIKQNRVYDPTNGTVSDGDIVRCQRVSESVINPAAP